MSDDADIRTTLERSLGTRVTAFSRRLSEYRTSFALDEVDVELADGRRLALVLKDVGPHGLHPDARAVKPAFLLDPRREIEVYRDLLAPLDLGTPRLHGADEARGWLFIERVEGVELFQVGARSTWEHVARWLAGAHERLAPAARRAQHVLRHDEAWYRSWAARALTVATGRGDEAVVAALTPILAAYDDVVGRLLALPVTLVHGEFYASNVLVDDPDRPARVAPVDWELAAVGAGVVDLAALTAGRWDDAARAAIASAYREAARDGVDDGVFAEGLEAARLHMALQWLGWSASWTPPVEHRQDWLSEATRAAGALHLI